MSSEPDFIDWVRARQSSSAQVLLPAGDDLAILKMSADDLLLVGVDQVLDGVHFDSRLHGPELIGRKAMNRNLSDCAAMACLPTIALVCVALPKGIGEDYARRLYDGIRIAGEAFDCQIVGGDTGSWDRALVVSVTILGRSAGVTPVRRSGAQPGDHVYVTGPLGGSITARHMTFTPRVREARALAQQHTITSMIDLSDGLSRDVAHIAKESRVGIRLESRLIPIHEDVNRLADARSPIEHALHDGEDYELCFTAAPGVSAAIRVGTVFAIDDVVDQDADQDADQDVDHDVDHSVERAGAPSGVWLDDRPLTPGAFAHVF